MMLKNFMEKKELDYNQPFLSARRFGASLDVEDNRKADILPALPFYKSELKSGPIRKAGTVPFVWEKSPGRPKDEKKSQVQSTGRPPVVPKLPPGRIMHAKQQSIDKVSEDPAIPRTQTGSPLFSSKNVSHSGETETKFDDFKNFVEDNQSFCSDNGDEAYMDAQDSLSRSESFFLNCSVSGVSGVDGLDVKQSGTFTDPKTRDFMMDRFLPAAKAIASETPQYVSRRQPVSWEHLGQPKKVTTKDNKHPINNGKLKFVPYYAQSSVEEESEGEDSEYGDQEILSGKVCGLLPRFCLKNSFFMMNPVPGIRVGSNLPASSVRTVRAKSSYAGAHIQTKNEHYKEITVDGLQKTELRSNFQRESICNQINKQTSSRKPDGSSLYRRLQGGSISPYHHENSQSSSQEGEGLFARREAPNNFKSNNEILNKNCVNNFGDLLDNHQGTDLEPGSESPMVEKTLYIDSVHILASSKSNSNTEGLIDTRENALEIPVKCWEMKQVDVEMNKVLEDDQNHITDLFCLEGSKLSSNGKMNCENNWPTKTKSEENPSGLLSNFPLPPPLPKSPSESWLCRTLPSVSSRNQSSRSFLSMHTRENSVKTSNGRVQFSKGSLTTIPEN